jgi:hypothetical protein
MHLSDVERVINLVPAHQLFGLNIDHAAGAPDETCSPQGDIVAASSDADQAREHPVAQLMDIIVIHGLPLIHLSVFAKHIVILVANRDDKSGRSRRNNSIHNNLIGPHVIPRYLGDGRRIHKQGSDQNNESSSDQ